MKELEYSPGQYRVSPGRIVTETIYRDTSGRLIELTNALERAGQREKFLEHELARERERNCNLTEE